MKILGEIITGLWGIVTTACFLAVGMTVALYYTGHISVVQFGKHLVFIAINY